MRKGKPGRKRVAVVGGGLAGCESAWRVANSAGADVAVDLFEMRPARMTPAHSSGLLAELVCSNSLKSESPQTPTGRLKEDLAMLGSLVIHLARRNRVPAGKALAVDRVKLAEAVTQAMESHPAINLVREHVTWVPEGYCAVIIATGPLTSQPMADSLTRLLPDERDLYFYDAIAPIVETDSVDMSVAFTQDRYGAPGQGDYLNLPMNRDEYESFVDALVSADRVAPKDFEKKKFFESCLPVEEIASRGRDSLAFGPLKPVGLVDPRDGSRPCAVVQLRKENVEGAACNLVGFQTRLTYPEQKRVFGMIPGLGKAEFLRFGSMHRNFYVNSPKALNLDLTLKTDAHVRLAGQITGVEGYVESIASGALAGIFTAGAIAGAPVSPPPPETTLGALLAYVTDPGRADNFQPSNINFSLLPRLPVKNRKERRKAVLELARHTLMEWMENNGASGKTPTTLLA